MCFRPTTFNRTIKRCPSCQAINPPALTNCNKCGADLPEQTEVLTGASSNEQDKGQNRGQGKPT